MDWPGSENETRCDLNQQWASFMTHFIHLPLVPHVCQWIGQALAQVMFSWLFGANPLLEPTLTYCHLDPLEQT